MAKDKQYQIDGESEDSHIIHLIQFKSKKQKNTKKFKKTKNSICHNSKSLFVA